MTKGNISVFAQPSPLSILPGPPVRLSLCSVGKSQTDGRAGGQQRAACVQQRTITDEFITGGHLQHTQFAKLVNRLTKQKHKQIQAHTSTQFRFSSLHEYEKFLFTSLSLSSISVCVYLFVCLSNRLACLSVCMDMYFKSINFTLKQSSVRF